MQLILKSDNKSKLAKVLALANKLGIKVEQKDELTQKEKPVLPKGKIVSTSELLENFGKSPDFPTSESVRSKAWPTSW